LASRSAVARSPRLHPSAFCNSFNPSLRYVLFKN
jgi:hypothetical protein